ncbi:hypothetical protein JZ751_009006 [Albula glossodonta]|uniref:Uncharacterized protein n=1 Tax=Albula glossodonta TaxID=121402 RepID=A0A8T2P292_9TELE|nr:hypothetical protein JZ751_009006 [Albula glossodonta]
MQKPNVLLLYHKVKPAGSPAPPDLSARQLPPPAPPLSRSNLCSLLYSAPCGMAVDPHPAPPPTITTITTLTSTFSWSPSIPLSFPTPPTESQPPLPLCRGPCLPWLHSWHTGTALLDGRGTDRLSKSNFHSFFFTRKQNYMMNFARQTGLRHYYSRKRRALRQRA